MKSPSWDGLPDLLSRLEDLELPLLSWGVVDGFLSEGDVSTAINKQLDADSMQRSNEMPLDEQAYLDRLLADGLLHKIPGTTPQYRTRLAETLVPAIATDPQQAVALATERLEGFSAIFNAAHDRVQRAKLGLSLAEPDDAALLSDLLERLAANEVDYTLLFRRLCDAAGDPSHDEAVAAGFADPAAFHPWAQRWRQRLLREPDSPADRRAAMRRVNPAFIPRNHRVEEIIAAAVQRGDLTPFETFTRVLEHPYEDQPEFASWREPPRREQRVQATFCGT